MQRGVGCDPELFKRPAHSIQTGIMRNLFA
jgi:hypothetical protein